MPVVLKPRRPLKPKSRPVLEEVYGVSVVMPFGKYEGCSIDAVCNDVFYRRWLLGEDWFEEKFSDLYDILQHCESEAPG
jgi:uncharacterized protein (DUF3820 family)